MCGLPMDNHINIVCRPKRLAPGGWLDRQKSGGKYKILSLYTSTNDNTQSVVRMYDEIDLCCAVSTNEKDRPTVCR